MELNRITDRDVRELLHTEPLPIGQIIGPFETQFKERLKPEKENDAMASQRERTIESPYFSPKELSHRWRCSRSSVDRIARRAGHTRLPLGKGRNGIIRYLRKQVIALERSLLQAKGKKIVAGKG
jgi:hypothetical protein